MSIYVSDSELIVPHNLGVSDMLSILCAVARAGFCCRNCILWVRFDSKVYETCNSTLTICCMLAGIRGSCMKPGQQTQPSSSSWQSWKVWQLLSWLPPRRNWEKPGGSCIFWRSSSPMPQVQQRKCRHIKLKHNAKWPTFSVMCFAGYLSKLA